MIYIQHKPHIEVELGRASKCIWLSLQEHEPGAVGPDGVDAKLSAARAEELARALLKFVEELRELEAEAAQ
jgi:hypothetical protein